MIDLVHSDKADPELLLYYNTQSLLIPPTALIATLTNRVATLKGYIADADQEKFRASEKVKTLWHAKLAVDEQLLKVFNEPTPDLKSEYLAKAEQRWDVRLKEVMIELNKEIVGPYALGELISRFIAMRIADVDP